MKASEKRSETALREDAADPYRGVPLGVEAAWWPQPTIVHARASLAPGDLDPIEAPDRAQADLELL
jgi:hypothetical protein